MSEDSNRVVRQVSSPVLGWRGMGWAWAIASIIGIAFASQIVLFTTSIGRAVPWTAALTSGLIDTWLWVPLVPVIFLLARHFPPAARRWPAHLAIHLVAGLTAGAVYTATQIAVTTWLIPDELRPAMFFRGFKPGPSPASREGRPDRPPPSAPPERPPRGPERERGHEPPPFLDRLRLGITSRLHVHLLTYAGIVAVWHGLAQQHRLRERERQAQELSRQLAEARLQALRMQLNPHFLFNTLNAVATLLHRDPRAADEMITCLSDFLRLTLSAANTPENPLQKELEFARCYLDIEKVRFGDRLSIQEEIPADCLPMAVPTLVLQPLLENAVRHGIEPNERQGFIRLRAWRHEQCLCLTVSDSGAGPGRPAANTPLPPDPSRRGGIGLSNTRARLRELYGDAASLTLRERDTGGLDVELRIPWRVPDSTTPA